MTKYIEKVIVKDYGKQGLAVFDPCDLANRGMICGWSTVLSYDAEKPGFRPDMTDCPMNYGEHSGGYFLDGKKPKVNDPRVAPFLERYRAWAEEGYKMVDETAELELKVVFKDQEAYRRERWKETR